MFLVLVGVGILIPLALSFPFLRAWILAAAITATAWVVLLPRGWFSRADHPTRQILTVFLLARLAMMVIFEAFSPGTGDLIGGGSDSIVYSGRGQTVADQLEIQGFSEAHRPAPGTGAIDLAVG